MAATEPAWEKIMVDIKREWSQRFDAIAKTEGWALFDTGDYIDIQALDEPGDAPALSDAEAYAFIAQQALNGSKMHILALFLDGKPCGLEPDGTLTPVYVPRILL